MSEPRVLGLLTGASPGPTLLAVGGIHGNEPSGLLALQRVLERLRGQEWKLRGELLALAGNRAALARGMRFLDRDLNRQWGGERLARVSGMALPGPPGGCSEDLEQRELLDEFERAMARARGPLMALDLHTTSAGGVPFSVVGESPGSPEFASHFPVTRVLGLQRELNGVMVEYLGSRGCVTLVVEGGQHQDPASVDRHEAVVWMALVSSGLLPESCAPPLGPLRALLEASRGSAPRIIQVSARYAIVPEDGFRMEPGFANIERVRRGALLARDRGGEIRAPGDAVLLMPLYQALGDDGFFLAREVG